MPTLTMIIRPWSDSPGYVAYAEAEYQGKKYVYDAHYSIWKDSSEDTFWGIDDDDLSSKLTRLICR